MSLSVTTNLYLRDLYKNDRSLVTKNNRVKVSNTELTKADSKALGQGISSLSDYDYEKENPDKIEFYNTLKAFADSYNYTLDSGGSSDDRTTKNLTKQMKALEEKYGEELSEFGISFDEHGYMSIGKSAIDNIDVSRFKEVFGKETDFLNELSTIQKRLRRHVNLLA